MGAAESNKKYYDKNREELLEKLKKKRASYSNKKKAHIKKQARTYHRRRLYGLTQDQYESRLRKQRYRCAICRKKIESLGVDHDRSCCPREGSCGKCIRGLLCLGCNTFLGFAKDSIKILRNGIEYLKEHKNNVIPQ